MMEPEPTRTSDFTIAHGILGQSFIVWYMGRILGVALDPSRAAAIVTAEMARQERTSAYDAHDGVMY